MKLNIRASSLSNYTDCPRRGLGNILKDFLVSYGYNLVDKPPALGNSFGTAAHAGIETLLNQKMLDLPINTTEASAKACGEFSKLLNKNINTFEFDNFIKDEANAHEKLTTLMNTYSSQVLYKINPHKLECAISFPINNKFTLTGHYDVLTKGLEVRDHKTGARSGYYKPQLGGYAIMVEGIYKKPVNGLYVDYFSRNKPTEYKEVSIDVEESKAIATQTLRYIEEDVDKFIKAEVAEVIPSNPNSMLCSSKWCSAWGTNWCHDWKKT